LGFSPNDIYIRWAAAAEAAAEAVAAATPPDGNLNRHRNAVNASRVLIELTILGIHCNIRECQYAAVRIGRFQPLDSRVESRAMQSDAE